MRRLFLLGITLALLVAVARAEVDTANKRGSVPLIPGVYKMLPIPDSTIDAGDRAQLAFLYRGFLDSEEPPPESSGSTSGGRAAAWFILSRRR